MAPTTVGAFARVTSALAPLAGDRRAQRMQAAFTATHVALYRATAGRVLGWFDTAPILLLTTVGRRSGRRRTAPVIYVPGEAPALVASNGGARRHPQWFLNLRAHPEATIEVGGERFEVVAEEVTGPERDEIWKRATAIYPGYARYQRGLDRQIPVVVLRPRVS